MVVVFHSDVCMPIRAKVFGPLKTGSHCTCAKGLHLWQNIDIFVPNQKSCFGYTVDNYTVKIYWVLRKLKQGCPDQCALSQVPQLYRLGTLTSAHALCTVGFPRMLSSPFTMGFPRGGPAAVPEYDSNGQVCSWSHLPSQSLAFIIMCLKWQSMFTE